jgi:hypothetical protein
MKTADDVKNVTPVSRMFSICYFSRDSAGFEDESPALCCSIILPVTYKSFSKRLLSESPFGALFLAAGLCTERRGPLVGTVTLYRRVPGSSPCPNTSVSVVLFALFG